MANNATISIGWKIEDAGNGLKTLTMSAEDLRRVLKMNVEESEKLRKNFVNFAAVCTSIDSVGNSLRSALAVVDDLCGAYDVQIEAERRLEQVMRNTMDATEEQIQNIKDYCSAQQKIGIIGDEVQLAGAQELATYLELQGSLKALIPVMNDMLAQQYGFNASGEAAAQIASMLGKVMEGQTGALSRYGYKFDEAQEKILKYGTESERVAVLVDVVSESVGGMNRAMAQTDSGAMQQFKNDLGDVKEELGRVLKGAQAPLTLAANVTIALAGVMKLVQGLKALNATLTATQIASGAIGIALAAVSAIVGYLMMKADDASEALDKFSTAEERAARAAEMTEEMTKAEDEARKSAASSLENNIARLKEFNGTKAEEKKLVKEMNDTYGQTMGYFKSVSQWYSTLIANSKAYCQQLVNEAKARKLADQIAELELDRDKIIWDDRKENKRKYATQREAGEWRSVTKAEYDRAVAAGKPHKIETKKGQGTEWAQEQKIYKVADWKEGSSDLDKAQAALDATNKQIDTKRKDLEKLHSTPVNMPVVGASTPPEPTTKKGTTNKEETEIQKIQKKINKLSQTYGKASEADKVNIRARIDQLMKEKAALELVQLEAQRPLTLDSLSAFSREIAYQRKLRETATEEDLEDIDEEIRRLERERFAFESKASTELECLQDYEEELSRLQSLRKEATAEQLALVDASITKVEEEKAAFERSSHQRIPADKIESYRQLEEEIQFCNELLREGTQEEKEWATANLPALRKKERAISSAIAGIGVAQTPAQADTLEEMDAALSLINEKIQGASAGEIDALTRTRLEFEKKKEAYERGIRIPEMEKEVADIERLTEKERKVRISGMGFDSLSEKIREIKRELADLDNPPTEGQRAALEKLMATYKGWQRQCALSFSTLEDGWSGIRQIGSGISGLSKTLTENGNAWELITGVVGAFLDLYNGISAVIGIMEMIGIVTKANAAAKTTEAAATTAVATASGVEAVAADSLAAAQIPAIAAAKVATSAFLELAAAQYMAAHSSIPFAGFGIGAGFASGAVGVVKGIGAIPFANGGIVYGPTLGLVGEYAGASGNPEVIAPLDKLRDIIGDRQPSGPVIVGGRVEIDGRKIAVVLENQSRIAGTSGRRYNR